MKYLSRDVNLTADERRVSRLLILCKHELVMDFANEEPDVNEGYTIRKNDVIH
jgi:hypothetical protein